MSSPPRGRRGYKCHQNPCRKETARDGLGGRLLRPKSNIQHGNEKPIPLISMIFDGPRHGNVAFSRRRTQPELKHTRPMGRVGKRATGTRPDGVSSTRMNDLTDFKAYILSQLQSWPRHYDDPSTLFQSRPNAHYIYYTILHHFLIAFAVRRHVDYVLFFCIPSNTLFQFYAALSIDQVDAT